MKTSENKIKIRPYMRVLHRYIGFFMAGIMSVYSISGILLVYRDTDFLKKEVILNKKLEPHLLEEELGKQLKIRNFKIKKHVKEILIFEQGNYNSKTGVANYTQKELPTILQKMTNLHKSKSKDKYSPLNVLFGISLFFLVISSFWMFNLKSQAFRKGMWYSIGGIILSIILLWFN